MITHEEVQELLANKAAVVDLNGEKIGKLEQIYLDDRTDEPEWATVSTGLFGSSESFVPLRGARVISGDLEVQCAKDIVKHAPRLDAGEHLAPAQEYELDRYYGLSEDPEQPVETSTVGTVRTDGGAEGGRNRFRKYVVTEVRQEPGKKARR